MPKFLDVPSWYNTDGILVYPEERLSMAVFSINAAGFNGTGSLIVPANLGGGNVVLASAINKYFDGSVKIPFTGAFRASADLITPLISLTITSAVTSVSYTITYIASNSPGGMVEQQLSGANVNFSAYSLFV